MRLVHTFQLPGVKHLSSYADADIASRTPGCVLNIELLANTEDGNTCCKVYYCPGQKCDLESVELIISVWYSGLLPDEDFYSRHPAFRLAQDRDDAERLQAEAQAEYTFLKAIEARCKELYQKRASSIST